MEILNSLFGKKKPKPIEDTGPVNPLLVDMHSHLLPGIDDGAKDMTESLAMIDLFVEMGYKKLVMTPHIMSDYYRNTPEIILEKLEETQQAARAARLDIQLEAAAEYYLDEVFLRMLEQNEKMLTFGKNYLLFELSFINPPTQLEAAIFMMQSKGFHPVLAHPERYPYWNDRYEELQKIKQKGVFLQINLMSLVGGYSKQAKKTAERLIEDGLVDFLGSDCHQKKQFELLEKARESSYYKKALQLYLLNNALI